MSDIIESEILMKVICHCVKTVEKKGLSIVFTFVCLLCSQFHANIVFFFFGQSHCPNKPLPPVVFSATFLIFK